MRVDGPSRHGRPSVARQSKLAALLGAILLVAVIVSPSLAAAPSQWHRNNYNVGHERLTCREATPSWTCFYESDVPNPEGTGWFSGRNVTDSWSCPEWFPHTICDNVTAVYHGIAVYTGPPPATVRQNYILTEVDGQAILQLYWVDRFVCPWYRSFEEALAADFNCVFAP